MNYTKHICKRLAIAACALAFASSAAPAAAAGAPLIEVKALGQEFTLGGTLEVSASATKQGGEKENKTSLDTFKLDIGAKPGERLTLSAAVLYEDGEDLCIDSAEFEYAFAGAEGLALHGGLLYMPFGVFETAMVSDPLTLELGEISDTAFGLTYGNGLFEVGAFAFGRDIGEDPEKLGYVGSLALTPREGVRLSAAVLSDICEAAMADDANKILGAAAPGEYDGAAGVDLAAVFEVGGVTLAGEYLAAAGDVNLGGEKSKPRAWAVDVAVAATDAITLAARYEGSKEFKPGEMPEMQVGGAVGYAFDDQISLAIEYMFGKFDGDDTDDRHLVTAKFAVEF